MRIIFPFFIIIIGILIYLGDSFVDGQIFGIFGVLTLTVLAYINWNKHGREEHCIIADTCYPPKNLNTAEVKMIFCNQDTLDDISTNNSGYDIAFLIIYLASKGYIKIEMMKKNIGYDFILYKQKEYSGEKKEEKVLMKLLFKNSDKISKEDLSSSTIYSAIQGILEKKKENYFEKKGCLPYFKMYGLWIGILICSTISIIGFDIFKEAIGIIPFVGIILSMFVLVSLFAIPGKFFRYILSTLLFLGFIFMTTMTIEHVELDSWVYPKIIFDTICFIITSICFTNISRRNEEGNILYQEILGYKKFLEKVDKNQLEEIVNKDKDYYNNILPFALVLGKSELLINKLKDLIFITPDWYEGDFDAKILNKFCYEIFYITYPKKSD